uniref:Protein broad-minded n=1 Tax=Denticeps clupeoides TaxID=299321 RepID=A0AAY4BMH9_9TELE
MCQNIPLDGARGVCPQLRCARAEGPALGSGHDTLVHAVTRQTRDSGEYKQMMQTLKNTMMVAVESLINKFEEDQVDRASRREQTDSQYTDNCSDSDSSFNQSYAFIRREQLQALADQLDPSRPKEVRCAALHALSCAPPSDVLNCDSWLELRRNISTALTDPDPDLNDKVLRFFTRTFSSSPLKVTREIYCTLAASLEKDFLRCRPTCPPAPGGLDPAHADVARLLKQVRLMNDFQKEVTSFWIRYPEKYMEEMIDSTLALLVPRPAPDRALQPVHLLALLDVRATWFKKWMHAYYSRTVVLRLLASKFSSVVVAALEQCIYYLDNREEHVQDGAHNLEQQKIDSVRSFRETELSSPGTIPQRSVTDNRVSAGPVHHTLYTGRALQYAHFVHSLCMLGRLLMYANGRRLFPCRVGGHGDPISLSDLMVILIRIMNQHPRAASHSTSHTDPLSPAALVLEVLWMQCDWEECAGDCLYQPAVTRALLRPVLALLEDPQGSQVKLRAAEGTLTNIGKVLARMAATQRGLALLLHDRCLRAADGQCLSAAHVVAQFTQKLLDGDWAGRGLSSFVFVCRQMYNTCEGLQVLRPYNLHQSLAATWRKTSVQSDRMATPVVGSAAFSTPLDMQNTLLWEETLLDNLLNFAATPKGLLLLQQTGAIGECIGYMFSRFTKKLQVSPCEKFGYGVMVTQVAATAPGITALCSSGFVQAIVVDLWSVLECGREDVRVVHPKATPMDPIDRSCLKPFLTLVNLLSSPYATWELLGGRTLANRPEYSLREIPTSIGDLVDRIIAVNSDAKIHSLFNYEQSHTFGLRLLSVMCCSLDSLLLLETQFGLRDVLLQNQRDNVTESPEAPGTFIIDGLSVERNHILVRMSIIGGPSERRLPPRVLHKGDDPYPWPMFSSLPVPKTYILDVSEATPPLQDSELSSFLATPPDHGWMPACRRLFCKVMTSDPDSMAGTVLCDLLEKVVHHLSSTPSECFFPPVEYREEEEVEVENRGLTPVEQLGLRVSLRYGQFLKLLREDSEADFCSLIRHSEEFLSRQRSAVPSDLHCLQCVPPGFDWLVSTVFMLMGGDFRRSLSFLLCLSRLLVSAFLWPMRLHASVHLPAALAHSGVPPVYSCSAHYVELLLKVEVPLVCSAFRMSGFTPSQVCVQWLGQCFWNYLDWSEISHYVATCIVLGPDYQVYTCIAVLKHLQPDILQHTHTQDLQVFLKEEPIAGFRVSSYLRLMADLERRYRNVVLPDMNSILHGTA